MYMVNIKKYLGVFLILASLLLSGCQKSNSANNSTNTESTISTEDTEGTDDISEYSPAPFAFPADRVYGDDELVPKEWIPVDSCMEGRDKVKEILSSDTSGDPESAIPALMDKNRLIFMLIYAHGDSSSDYIYKYDWYSPYESPNFEKSIYPLTFTSEYFTDLQDIYKLVYDTYEKSVAEDLLQGWNGEQLFVEENGQMYANINVFPNWSSNPFVARSYVEIKEKTDNKCTFIWHYPDIEMLNTPENGYEFFYFEKIYTAEYIDGAYKFNSIVFDNAD